MFPEVLQTCQGLLEVLYAPKAGNIHETFHCLDNFPPALLPYRRHGICSSQRHDPHILGVNRHAQCRGVRHSDFEDT